METLGVRPVKAIALETAPEGTIAAKAADSDKVPPGVRKVLALQSADLSKLLGEQFDKQVQSISKSVQDRITGEIGKQLGEGAGKDVGKDVGNAVEGGLKDLAGSLNKKPASKPSTGGS